MKKLKLVVLLFPALTLLSCTPTSTEEVVKEVNPTDISIKIRKTQIGLNEKVLLQAEILPKEATQIYTVTSSDPSYITVENNYLIGKKLTQEGQVIKITVTTDQIKNSIDCSVVSSSFSALNELTPLLKASKELEKSKVSTGEFVFSQEQDSGEYSKNTINYEIFNNNTSEYTSSSYMGDPNEMENELVASGIYQDRYYKATYTIVDGKKQFEQYDSENYLIKDNPEGYDEISMDEALSLVNSPNLLSSIGLSRFVEDTFLSLEGVFFTNEESINNISYSYEDGVYKMITSFLDDDSYVPRYFDVSLSMLFKDGILVNLDSYKAEYMVGDDDEKGALDRKMIYKATQSLDERKAPKDTSITFENSLMFKDFDCYLSNTSYNGKKVESYKVGETAYLYYLNQKPEEATAFFDDISIVEVSVPEAIELDDKGHSFKFLKSVENLKVTLKSKNVTKELTVSASLPTAEGLELESAGSEFYLPSSWIINTPKKFKVLPVPSGSVINLTVDTSELNTAGATVKKNDDGTYTLEATKEGSVKIKFTDESILDATKKTLTKEVKFYANSDQGLEKLLVEGTYKGSTSISYSTVSDIEFEAKKDSTSQNNLYYSIKEYGSEEADLLTTHWQVKDKVLSFLGETTTGTTYYPKSYLRWKNYPTYGPSVIEADVIDDYDGSISTVTLMLL